MLVAILIHRGEERRFDEQDDGRNQAIEAAYAGLRESELKLTAAYDVPFPLSAEDRAQISGLTAELAAARAAHLQATNAPIPQRPWPLLWLVAGITGFLPVWIVHTRIWYLNRRRQRRRDAECCVHCGYDIRATPQRCPECGNDPIGLAPQEPA